MLYSDISVQAFITLITSEYRDGSAFDTDDTFTDSEVWEQYLNKFNKQDKIYFFTYLFCDEREFMEFAKKHWYDLLKYNMRLKFDMCFVNSILYYGEKEIDKDTLQQIFDNALNNGIKSHDKVLLARNNLHLFVKWLKKQNNPKEVYKQYAENETFLYENYITHTSYISDLMYLMQFMKQDGIKEIQTKWFYYTRDRKMTKKFFDTFFNVNEINVNNALVISKIFKYTKEFISIEQEKALIDKFIQNVYENVFQSDFDKLKNINYEENQKYYDSQIFIKTIS